ncbi:MAG: CoA transferase [Chloroflexi bacterium]|nr:CoA transferase [Chloroflexota bacterium]
MALPLDGVRILDLSIWQQGPYATALLSDLGADVIKVEETISGDPGRHFGVDRALGVSAYFEAHNRGKRSIALNLKSAAGREVLLRLAGHADAFLTNVRVGAIERLKLTYEALAEANPRIVYVQASGHGHYGDDADAGSFDILAQARGGLMSVMGEPGGAPGYTGVPIADQVGALHAAVAVLSGVVAARATGRGMKFDTSLLGSQVSLQAFDLTAFLFTGRQRARAHRAGGTPFWHEYRGSDGHWFVIGMLLPRAWPEVTEVVGRPELADDERFDTYAKRVGEHAAALIEILDAAFAAAPARAWVERLNAIGMFAAPIQDYAEVAADPQVVANGYITEVDYPAGPLRVAATGIVADGTAVPARGPAPHHGAHTEEVMLQAGFSWDEIAALRAAGAVGPAK